MCYICGSTYSLDLHHCFFAANRELSDEDGLTVYLCRAHHTGDKGVHFNKEMDLKIKRMAQAGYMRHYNKSIEEFRERYGKSWL